MAELGISSARVACMATLLLLCVSSSSSNEVRSKRQISPAVRLQNELDPLIALYGFNQLGGVKRSEQQAKRHIAPALSTYQEMSALNDLMNVGKRHISLSDDISRQAQLYNKLFDAGRKRAVSPALELQEQLELNDFLERTGRR